MCNVISTISNHPPYLPKPFFLRIDLNDDAI